MLFGAEVSAAVLRGEVAASMKKKCYTVEISYDLDDGIVSAKCSCPRGLAVCHHMAALCIHAHHNVSMTDKTCLWNKRKPAETEQVTKISDIYKPIWDLNLLKEMQPNLRLKHSVNQWVILLL
ncbi:unnamed protein product [Acanthoscelides obtectus]|uniref:SWIM-type domain-containing protein n=1 Tax=Acanthoscelides obtectus TaxID=200917 RepID=A0A9P0PVN7_ACAOB|nr:unnamed protein product [Acanthoscelides obtectus]CAK1671556.1 hypothetical protein AOBTE_LOCUS28314 [Acanthoscelides obtectus]